MPSDPIGQGDLIAGGRLEVRDPPRGQRKFPATLAVAASIPSLVREIAVRRALRQLRTAPDSGETSPVVSSAPGAGPCVAPGVVLPSSA